MSIRDDVGDVGGIHRCWVTDPSPKNEGQVPHLLSDLDLLGRGTPDSARLVGIFREKSADLADRSTTRQPPLVPEHRPYPRLSQTVSGIVFESSTACIETPPDVANSLAKSALRYIWRQLDTRQPDLGSGAARRGGSSPSSCTVVGAFGPAPLK